MSIALFLIFSLTLILGLHYVLYLSIVHFFSITGTLQKNFLFTFLFFLAISFILASFLIRWEENIFTRGYYLLSGWWLGFFLNLLLGLVLGWIIIAAAKISHWPISLPILGCLVILGALGYSIYGVWNANHPKLKDIAVTIPNLPQEWKGKKIVQISDVHVGVTQVEDFLEKVVSQVNVVNPEMVLITGDMFDGMDGALSNLVKPIDRLKAKKGVFFVTGNHETYVGLSEVLPAIRNTKARVLEDEVVDVDGLKIIGISYPERREEKDVVGVLRSLKNQYEGNPNILLYHAPVEIEKIKNSGVNLELCGHTHHGQMFPLGYITQMIYKGYDYGFYPMGDYTLYTTNGTGTWGVLMRTGNIPEIVVITLE